MERGKEEERSRRERVRSSPVERLYLSLSPLPLSPSTLLATHA